MVEIRRNEILRELDGGCVLCDVLLPPAEFGDDRPGVLLLHGGGWIAGDKAQTTFIGERLARAGFVVVNANYRLAPTYKFPAQLDDVRAGVAWMRENAENLRLRPTWLAAYGYSAGAHLALLLAVAEELPSETFPEGFSPDLQAVVAGGAPCDFREIRSDAIYLSYWLGDTRRKAPDQYRNASPAHFVATARSAPPIFFYHGELDLLVSVDQSRTMCELLKEHGHRAEHHALPELGHIGTFGSYAAADSGVNYLKASYEEFLKQEAEEKATANKIIEQTTAAP